MLAGTQRRRRSEPGTDLQLLVLAATADGCIAVDTESGALVRASYALPEGIDPARSRLSVNIGVSPLPMIRGMAQRLHVYPYYCSEQVVSAAMPLIVAPIGYSSCVASRLRCLRRSRSTCTKLMGST